MARTGLTIEAVTALRDGLTPFAGPRT
jgi:hypothetical protein